MIERIQHIGLLVKSALFTIVIHGILLAMLLVGQWQFSQESIKRGTTKPIQAQVISTDYIQQRADEKERQEAKKKKKREQEKKRQEAEKKKNREQAEKKRKEQAEKKRLDAEKKKKREQEKKRQEAEKKKNREQAEKKRKEQAEKKRLDAEKKKEREQAEKKRQKAEGKKEREQALKAKLEEELRLRQRAQTKLDAATALSALVDRIAIAIENNWRRPLNSATGLEVTINVKVSRNGNVLSANVVKSSGDPFFDQSAERAVKKASPLPFPSDPKYYEFIDDFNIKFNPDDE